MRRREFLGLVAATAAGLQEVRLAEGRNDRLRELFRYRCSAAPTK